MKINREMIVSLALTILQEEGLERLTLRRLAAALDVQAATLYWHFASKEVLLDEMATSVLTDGLPHLVPADAASEWRTWARTFGEGLRRTLLAYRDGARMASGTRLTNTNFLATTERIGGTIVAAGFPLRDVVVLMSTIYNYTLSFVAEEQAVFPTPGVRSPRYSLESRKAALSPTEFPFHHGATDILFDQFDRRFSEGLALIIDGAAPRRAASRSSKARGATAT